MRMKTQIFPSTGRETASTLVLVLVLAAAGTVTLLGILGWSRTNTNLVGRHNQYLRSQVAAEAAVEKIVAKVGADYQNYGVPLVVANLDTYRATVPTASEYAYWSGYRFLDERGAANRVSVDWLPLTTNTFLSTKYKGLRGFAYDMRIVSLAQELNTPYSIATRVEQNLSFSLVPIFQYAIFYNGDLEFNRCAPMVVTGPVHCNANIYGVPFTTLDFNDQVTAAGKLWMNICKPGDSQGAGSGKTYFHSSHTENVPSLNLPLGTNNTAAAAHQIIEVPPWTESANSLLGQLRYYNQADMIITISNSVRVTSGLWDNFSTVVPWTNQASLFVKTNLSFYDDRENKTVRCTEIDIDKLRRWNWTNSFIGHNNGRDISVLYVADLRPNSGGATYAVRLVNGQCLPPKGLTVATFNPLYVKGHYNVCTNACTSATVNPTPVNLGTTNTTQTKPASFAADALTILSANWSDASSSGNPSDMTINAAILAGNSVTANNNFGGGVHNLPRFLEDWTGDDFYINGSIVSMFPSQIAVGLWSRSYYAPPNRYWGYDANFNDPTKLPPATPQVRLMVRGQWLD